MTVSEYLYQSFGERPVPCKMIVDIAESYSRLFLDPDHTVEESMNDQFSLHPEYVKDFKNTTMDGVVTIDSDKYKGKTTLAIIISLILEDK